MSFDANTQTLYFPDGSYWNMGCRYAAGIGAPWANSSARILQIEDVRGVQVSPSNDWVTLQFNSTPPGGHGFGIRLAACPPPHGLIDCTSGWLDRKLVPR